MDDLKLRWARARARAIELELGGPAPESVSTEFERVREANSRDLERLLKRAFTFSLVLGQGFRRHHGVEPEARGLARFLPRLAVPCLEGRLIETPQGHTLARPSCQGSAPSKAVCEYMKEATAGLVAGLAPTLAITRLASAARGRPECVDRVHLAEDLAARFAPVPDALLEGLAAAIELVAKSGGSRPEVLGLVEDELHYRMSTSPDGPSLRAMFERAVARRFPELPLIEDTPRAVLAP